MTADDSASSTFPQLGPYRATVMAAIVAMTIRMTAELVRRVVNPATRRSPVVQIRRDRGARSGVTRDAGSMREAPGRVASAFAGSFRTVGAVRIAGTLAGVLIRRFDRGVIVCNGLPFLISSTRRSNELLG